MQTIDCVDAAAAAKLVALLTDDSHAGVTADGPRVNLKHATARATLRAILVGARDGLVSWEAAAELIEGLDLDSATTPQVAEVRRLAAHLDLCPLAESQCAVCSGVGARFGKVAAVRQLIDTRGARGYTTMDVAELMVGAAVMLCAADECSTGPTAPAVRTVHHPIMGSLPLCDADALYQERRNLR